MQSLDSSCREADFIIHDALLKLNGSSAQSNINSNSMRQATISSSPLSSQIVLQQHSIQHQYQSNSLLQNVLNVNNQISNQPSSYIFDGVDLPNITENDLLETVNHISNVDEQQQDIGLSNVISSPPLSTSSSVIISSPVISTSSILNCSQSPSTSSTRLLTTTVPAIKLEKRSLLVESDNINLLSSSSSRKRSKLSSAPAITATATTETASPLLSTISQNAMSSPPSSTCTRSSNRQLFLNSSILSVTGDNSPSSTMSLPQHIQEKLNTIKTEDIENFKTASDSVAHYSSYNSLPGTSTGILTSPISCLPNLTTTKTMNQSSLPLSNILYQSNCGSNNTVTTAATNMPTNFSSLSNSSFDIYDELREEYFLLLIDDERSFKENRQKHRTRSFVLEKLVERRKLNTIVLNLYPGNKGYSLAVYCQDNKNNGVTSFADGGNNTHIERGGGGSIDNSVIGLSDSCGTEITDDESKSIINANSAKLNLQGSSSRIKQTQINNSSNLNNNNNLQLDDEILSEMTTGITKTSITVDSDERSNIERGSNNDINSTIVSEEISTTNTTSTITTTTATSNTTATMAQTMADNYVAEDETHLIELMRWPYEIDDLLQSINNEELPSLFLDILESRMPNVFYSGCVICQVRDFRQTFPISSNSCDIYHVLLKPTNEILYSDVNQLSIDYDMNPEDRLQLESLLILSTSEPLCLDPNPKIGEYAINKQYQKQLWNTSILRRQMKRYSQISINRKRKIDQFTHNYGLELSDYLQRLRQRPRISSAAGGINNSTGVVVGNLSSESTGISSSMSSSLTSFTSKLPKKPVDIIKPIRTPTLDYPPLDIPSEIDVENYAKAYKCPGETKDCMPQLIEEYILEIDREDGQVNHTKLSIFQRPSNSVYFGELYVDRDYKEGQRNGEACQFSLGTRSHANRYIQQFTEIFTEEGRKSVKITHVVPGKEPKVSCTSGMSENRRLQQQQAAALAAALQQQQLHHQVITTAATSVQSAIITNQQQQQQQHQQHQQFQIQQGTTAIHQTQQLIATTPATINTTTNTGNQLNINLQGANIVGITTTGGDIQHLRQSNQQIFDAATVSVQTQSTQQLNLGSGSLVFVQQPGSAQGITIQTASNQQKAQMLANANVSGQLTSGAIRTQLTSNVPVLQTQLRAAPIVTGQQQILQQNIVPTTLVTGLMNNHQIQQQQQQQQQQIQIQKQTIQKKSGNAILSILNSAPAAMTNSSVLTNAFNPPAGQQQQPHQPISADNLMQQQQQLQQKRQNDVVQNLLSNNQIRKISMVTSGSGGTTALGRTNTNLIVSAVGLNHHQDVTTTPQNVRVTMSALASQLASPPAIMTNATAASYGYANTTTVNNNTITAALNSNNIKILNNTGRVINANSLSRRDSSSSTITSTTTAVPSPGSDSNASNASATSNLGFAMPGLSALVTTSPSPNSDHSQSGTNGGGTLISNMSNQTFLERLNNVNTSPGLSPQQPSQQQQTNLTKNIMQHVNSSIQSPSASISPLSSPPPQPSSQQIAVPQTTTLNLQGINLQSLQGAMATFPGIQNVQVQIPGLTQPISLQLSGASLAAAVQQQQAANQQTGSAAGQQTSLLVSVPVTSNNPIVSGVPATVAATQTVVLTNAAAAGNPPGSVTGSVLSLPIAQLVASSVKNLNPQTIRTTVTGSGSSNTTQAIVNASIIQATSAGANLTTPTGVNNALTGTTVNMSMNNSIGNGSGGNQPIQLLGTIQQRPRNIQVVGAKQINRGQLNATQQRSLPNSAIKIAANSITGSPQITTNITANPIVMTTQKVHLKLQKSPTVQQQQQAALIHHQQQQQASHIQISGSGVTSQRIMAAMAVANQQSQKRRRSATDANNLKN